MVKKENIERTIEKIVEKNKETFFGIFTLRKYSKWYIGVTNDVKANKSRHKNPENYQFWKCISEKDARDIEKHFLSLGMKGAPGGGTNNYIVDIVYIYEVE
jgi:hypothetical protein